MDDAENVNLKRKHRTVIIDSDSDEDCKGISKTFEVQRSDVDCIENSFTDAKPRKKGPKEIAIEKAIKKGTRLAKKIEQLEFEFSNDHVEDKAMA